MAKKDDDKTLPSFEEWLAPWERDDDGNKLDEPAELDPERLKKLLYNLFSDKRAQQERLTATEAERDEAKAALTDLQRKNESDEQRREREDKERADRLAEYEKRDRERAKVDAISDAFEEQGITPAQARRLAGRVKGDDERAWLDDAKELVEDGFKIGSAKTNEAVDEDPPVDDLGTRPRRVVRADGAPADRVGRSTKTPREQLVEAGLMDTAY